MIQKFSKKSNLFVVFGIVMFLVVGAICLTDSVNAASNLSNISGNDEEILDEKGTEKTNDNSNSVDNQTEEGSSNEEDQNTDIISNTEVSSSNGENPNNDITSYVDTNLSDMDVKVKEYILNGQYEKPETLKLKWSNSFLNQVDIESLYNQYKAKGGNPEGIEKFAEYITLNAPIPDNWQELFKKDLYDIYGEEAVRIEYLEGDLYQVYVIKDGKEVPYVAVSARTGYFHG